MARDPGLQRERTALAWQRTGLSASGVGVAEVFVAAPTGRPGLVVMTALLAVVSAVCSIAGAMSGSRLARARDGAGFCDATGSPWLRLVATAVATALVAVSGILLSLG